MMSANQVVKLRRKELAACMTCPICNKLLRDATTVPECLHTCESVYLFGIVLSISIVILDSPLRV
ncbi:putative E3 ubiquitin-protein ligase/polycomb group RING finger protein [Helianthus annuus]|nr:putative E3 ubiquitin-protein ligase/polycomb group RING finger protein [Helianthus annuus]